MWKARSAHTSVDVSWPHVSCCHGLDFLVAPSQGWSYPPAIIPHGPLAMLKAGGRGAHRVFPHWMELFSTADACFWLEAGRRGRELTPGTRPSLSKGSTWLKTGAKEQGGDGPPETRKASRRVEKRRGSEAGRRAVSQRAIRDSEKHKHYEGGIQAFCILRGRDCTDRKM